MVQLKLLEFSEFRGCQPSVHHAGYGQQVACRDVEALNGALLVRGDDGSKEIKFRKDRYLTTVEARCAIEGATGLRGLVCGSNPWWGEAR